MKKQEENTQTGLFGIHHSNREADAHWGKNCFNSSFPASLACYMLANKVKAIYNKLAVIDGELRVIASEISLIDVFNCGALPLEKLDFIFESVFSPYQQYSFDYIDGIDLIIQDIDGTPLAPLEVKLTVLPTASTSHLSEEHWGCEMVVRSATTSYCALGMFDAVRDHAQAVREIFEDVCSDIQSWDNDYEMTHKTPYLSAQIDVFQRKYLNTQKPLLMQTIWKTQGQSPMLADNAFDIVVWSDYAFSRLFVDSAFRVERTMSRPMRASARLARCLWELSKSGKIRIRDIYRQMAFGNQTDKEFAIQGAKWRKYVSSDRIVTPILHKDALGEIIKPGYIDRLMPERRFDQTLYFTVRIKEEERELEKA
ncbi:MAG: HindVP family restriction endonuclease [Eubacteriaceae bacterium]|nr:HindVP family restriction endonuclease [Eubacteriaceae bacterium]